jgi:hypothetical protein
MRTLSMIVLLSCLACATACNLGSPAGPTVSLNEQFTLSPGRSASVSGTSLRVEFLRVSGDSRCPTDALCIQGGDAIVHLRVVETSAAEYELHTGDATRAAVTHGSFRIQLVQLQPYPFSSRTIDPSDYQATLAVTR